MNNATDFLGKPLKVGDKVVFMKLNYRDLDVGTVKKITAKMLLIDNGSSDGVRQYHSQVVKV